jgi:excisionase family DNA binding protein
VRLKPESREQLLERLRNPQLSLHEASILLRVSRATVRRYADSGRLTCQRTPGGQRRFFLRDIETFYRQLKMKK